MKKIKIWLISRFKEKSTITALIGLLYVILSHTNILPPDTLEALSGFIIALLVTSAGTEG